MMNNKQLEDLQEQCGNILELNFVDNFEYTNPKWLGKRLAIDIIQRTIKAMESNTTESRVDVDTHSIHELFEMNTDCFSEDVDMGDGNFSGSRYAMSKPTFMEVVCKLLSQTHSTSNEWVDVEKLVEECESILLETEGQLCYCGVSGNDHTTYNDISNKLVKHILSQSPKSSEEWVDVKERLPEIEVEGVFGGDPVWSEFVTVWYIDIETGEESYKESCMYNYKFNCWDGENGLSGDYDTRYKALYWMEDTVSDKIEDMIRPTPPITKTTPNVVALDLVGVEAINGETIPTPSEGNSLLKCIHGNYAIICAIVSNDVDGYHGKEYYHNPCHCITRFRSETKEYRQSSPPKDGKE